MSDYKTHEEMTLEDYGKYYSVRFYCGNCRTHFSVHFKLGIKKHMVICPNCECEVQS